MLTICMAAVERLRAIREQPPRFKPYVDIDDQVTVL